MPACANTVSGAAYSVQPGMPNDANGSGRANGPYDVAENPRHRNTRRVVDTQGHRLADQRARPPARSKGTPVLLVQPAPNGVKLAAGRTSCHAVVVTFQAPGSAMHCRSAPLRASNNAR